MKFSRHFSKFCPPQNQTCQTCFLLKFWQDFVKHCFLPKCCHFFFLKKMWQTYFSQKIGKCFFKQVWQQHFFLSFLTKMTKCQTFVKKCNFCQNFVKKCHICAKILLFFDIFVNFCQSFVKNVFFWQFLKKSKIFAEEITKHVFLTKLWYFFVKMLSKKYHFLLLFLAFFCKTFVIFC